MAEECLRGLAMMLIHRGINYMPMSKDFFGGKSSWGPGGGGVLPIKAYTGRLRPKGVPFSGFRYIKG